MPNNRFLRGYALTLGLGTMQLPLAMTGGSALTDIYQSFFGWTEDELVFWNSFMGATAALGLMLGSLIGGRLIRKGRRRATLLIQAIAVFASILTCFRFLPGIVLGRLLLGFAGSSSCLIMGKSIGETMPSSMTAKYGMLTNIFVNVGFMFCFVLGLLLPTDPAEFPTNEMWKVVSLMPALFGLLTIILWSLI